MKLLTNKKIVAIQVAALCGVGALVGCLGGQGSTDGGSGADNNYQDNVFVSDETTTGSLKIELTRSSLNVGDTAGFIVRVVNAQGEPVSNINVACDSESGVAIVEPQRGYELTNSQGEMSGVIGCESPGSYQMVCRLSVGANRRKFADIVCNGPTPSGFDGFPDAGGGGLGGGREENDDGDVRIVAVGLNDTGSSDSSTTTTSIDISQIGDCDGNASTVDIEPFYDTYVSLKVENNYSENVRFRYLQYSISDVDGKGTEFTSKRLGVTAEAGANTNGTPGTATIGLPIFKAYGGGKFVGDPLGFGIQITNASLQTISFVLVGETASGDSVELKARATASFGNFVRCSAPS